MHPGFAHKCFNRLIIPKGLCSLLFVCFLLNFKMQSNRLKLLLFIPLLNAAKKAGKMVLAESSKCKPRATSFPPFYQPPICSSQYNKTRCCLKRTFSLCFPSTLVPSATAAHSVVRVSGSSKAPTDRPDWNSAVNRTESSQTRLN